jgi:hypothetical protein
MKQEQANAPPPGGAKQVSKGRKPYEKPSFRHERIFETMALSCGKIHSTQAQCKFNRSAS